MSSLNPIPVSKQQVNLSKAIRNQIDTGCLPSFIGPTGGEKYNAILHAVKEFEKNQDLPAVFASNGVHGNFGKVAACAVIYKLSCDSANSSLKEQVGEIFLQTISSILKVGDLKHESISAPVRPLQERTMKENLISYALNKELMTCWSNPVVVSHFKGYLIDLEQSQQGALYEIVRGLDFKDQFKVVSRLVELAKNNKKPQETTEMYFKRFEIGGSTHEKIMSIFGKEIKGRSPATKKAQESETTPASPEAIKKLLLGINKYSAAKYKEKDAAIVVAALEFVSEKQEELDPNGKRGDKARIEALAAINCTLADYSHWTRSHAHYMFKLIGKPNPFLMANAS